MLISLRLSKWLLLNLSWQIRTCEEIITSESCTCFIMLTLTKLIKAILANRILNRKLKRRHLLDVRFVLFLSILKRWQHGWLKTVSASFFLYWNPAHLINGCCSLETCWRIEFLDLKFVVKLIDLTTLLVKILFQCLSILLVEVHLSKFLLPWYVFFYRGMRQLLLMFFSCCLRKSFNWIHVIIVLDWIDTCPTIIMLRVFLSSVRFTRNDFMRRFSVVVLNSLERRVYTPIHLIVTATFMRFGIWLLLSKFLNLNGFSILVIVTAPADFTLFLRVLISINGALNSFLFWGIPHDGVTFNTNTNQSATFWQLLHVSSMTSPQRRLWRVLHMRLRSASLFSFSLNTLHDASLGRG